MKLRLSHGHGYDDPGVRVFMTQVPVQFWYGAGYRTGCGSQCRMSSWSFTLRAGVATAVHGLSVAHARGGVGLHARGRSAMTRCHCLYGTGS
jgi:hypothetical protein